MVPEIKFTPIQTKPLALRMLSCYNIQNLQVHKWRPDHLPTDAMPTYPIFFFVVFSKIF